MAAINWTNFAAGSDMRAFSDITIICTAAPTTPGKVMISEDGTAGSWRYVALIDQLGNFQNASGGNTVSAVNTSYNLFEGNCFVMISGEAGGQYQIKGVS